MISIDGLTVEFGGTTLFSDLNFQINEKDRIALMGKNGAGKSTLLKNFGRRSAAHPWKSDGTEGLCDCLSAPAPDDGGWPYGV